MAAPVLVEKVPTMDDAKRAALACIRDPRVYQVSVFGSVARGEAREHSDIDLLLLVDRAWGKRTRDIKAALEPVAEKASGHSCDLIIETPAVWRHLTNSVSASFEAAIHPEVVLLESTGFKDAGGSIADMPGKPASNEEIVRHNLKSLTERIVAIESRLSGVEKWTSKISALDLSPEEDEMERNSGYITLLETAHLGIEMAIKTVGVLSEGKALGKQHDHHRLLEQISDCPEKEDLLKAVSKLREHQGGDLLVWRLGPYQEMAERLEPFVKPENCAAHIHALADVSEVAINMAEKHIPDLDSTLRKVAHRQLDQLRSFDVSADFLAHGRHSSIA